jgi:hypothetical protein
LVPQVAQVQPQGGSSLLLFCFAKLAGLSSTPLTSDVKASTINIASASESQVKQHRHRTVCRFGNLRYPD